jgi:hypothetical protein
MKSRTYAPSDETVSLAVDAAWFWRTLHKLQAGAYVRGVRLATDSDGEDTIALVAGDDVITLNRPPDRSEPL